MVALTKYISAFIDGKLISYLELKKQVAGQNDCYKPTANLRKEKKIRQG